MTKPAGSKSVVFQTTVVLALCAGAIALSTATRQARGDSPTRLADSGAAWETTLGGFNSISALHALSPTDVWAVGSNIVHGDGQDWLAVDHRDFPGGFRDLDFASDGMGWAAGEDVLVPYRDGEWQAPVALPDTSILGLDLVSTTEGWAVGFDDRLRRTVFYRLDDTGWQLRQSLEPGAPILSALWLDDAAGGWAVGEAGAIYRLTDQNWAPVSSPGSVTLTTVAGLAPDDVWAGGGYGPGPFDNLSSRVLLHFDGQEWTEARRDQGSGFVDMAFRDGRGLTMSSLGELLVYEAGAWAAIEARVPANRFFQATALSLLPGTNDAILGTSDGRLLQLTGATLTELNSTADLDSIEAVASDRAWALGQSRVLEWDGDRWIAQSDDHPLAGMRDLSAAGPEDVWAVGAGGRIQHFDGQSWQPVESPTTVDLDRVRAISPSLAWAAGSAGERPPYRSTILRYDGEGWQVVWDEPGSWDREVADVDGTSAEDAWVVSQGSLWHYHDGRLDWVSSDQSIYSVDMQTSESGWVGGRGTVLRWDGTSLQESIDIPAGASVHRLRMLPDGSGWAVGWYGYVLYFDGQAWRIVRGAADAAGDYGVPYALYDLSLSGDAADSQIWVAGVQNSILRASRQALIDGPGITPVAQRSPPSLPFTTTPTPPGTPGSRNTPGPPATERPWPLETPTLMHRSWLPYLNRSLPDSAPENTSTPEATPTRAIVVPPGCPRPLLICRLCPGCTTTPVPADGTPTVCPDCRPR
jgi:hypothetical protein